jgi:hypothetical protein
VPRQFARDRPAGTLTRAGDNCHLALQVEKIMVAH